MADWERLQSGAAVFHRVWTNLYCGAPFKQSLTPCAKEISEEACPGQTQICCPGFPFYDLQSRCANTGMTGALSFLENA